MIEIEQQAAQTSTRVQPSAGPHGQNRGKILPDPLQGSKQGG
jgi:hypothetical protein